MWNIKLVNILRRLSFWLFWPGVAVIAWGELTPQPPQLSGVLAWDKADHFIAYLGLAGMATLAMGLRPRLISAILGLILLSGALEILQAFTGRDADLLDFAANTLGALTGGGAGALLLILLVGRDALVAAPAPD